MLTRPLIAELKPHERIILALDHLRRFEDKEKRFIDKMFPLVGMFKIGLKAIYTRTEASTVALEAYDYITGQGGKIMLDAKLVDTLNTLAGTCDSIAWWPTPPDILTIYANVRQKSIEAAMKATILAGGGILFAGVSALTDHDDTPTNDEVFDVYNRPTKGVVTKCASRLTLASEHLSMPTAIVSSPKEAKMLFEVGYKDLIKITPGIRPAGSPPDDQARTMEAGEAIRAGTDFVVVGRPIIESDRPIASAKGIAADIEREMARP
jgi:orotidine-5'-phosphate decarboxylase